MKILKLKIYKLYIWAMIICMTNFFGFYKYLPFGMIFYTVDYMYLCILSISLLFLLFLLIGKGHEKIKIGAFWKCSLGLIILIGLEIIWTYVRYHQPFILTLKEGFYYIIPLFTYFIFLQFRSTKLSAKNICDIFVMGSILASLVAIVAFILYTYVGINILQLADDAINFRYGTIRFHVGTLVVYMAVIISLTRVFGKSYASIDIINLILALFHILVINKTRTIILYFIIMTLVVMLIEKRMKKAIKAFVILLIAVCLFGIFISFDTISGDVANYVNQEAGIKIRFDTINFLYEAIYRSTSTWNGLN